MRTPLGFLLVVALLVIPDGRAGSETVTAFALPTSGTLVVGDAVGEVTTVVRTAIVRYVVMNRPPGILSTNPYEPGRKLDVTAAQIEDVVARLEEAGVAPNAITVQRYRPFNALGSPLGIVGILTVARAPTLDSLNRLYAADIGVNAQYLGTWSAVDGCEILRQAAIRTAQRAALRVASAAARAFDSALVTAVHEDERPLADPADADRITTVADMPTYCAGDPPPPVQSIEPSLSTLGSAPRTVFSALVLAAYRAAHATTSQNDVATHDAAVIPSNDLGEPQFDPLKIFKSSTTARYYSVEMTRFVRTDRPAGWLVTLAPNGATVESVRSILQDMGTPAADVLERVSPRGTREVVIKLTADRTRVERFFEDFHARALRANVPVETRVLAFEQDCDDLLQSATGAAALAARESAASFARTTGLRLGRLAAVSARARLERLACEVASSDVQTLAEIPDAAAAYPSDMPLAQAGRVRASVRVFYALR